MSSEDLLGINNPAHMSDNIKNFIVEQRQKCNESNLSMEGELHCPWEFNVDSVTCWPSARAGDYAYIPCYDKPGQAVRQCLDDGTWRLSDDADTKKIWVNFSQCLAPVHQNITMNTQSVTGNRMNILMTIGYSISAVFLFAAMFVFVYYRRLHCTRNYIHLHLFASFFLRAIIVFVKNAVLFSVKGVNNPFEIEELINDQNLDHGQYYKRYNKMFAKPSQSKLNACKLVVSLYHYFVATNYFWILVEGIYLHCLIFVTFFAEKKYMIRFVLIGWGLPLLFVIPWSFANEFYSESNRECWSIERGIHDWLFNGPIIAANFVNFFLFLNIVRVLWYKLRYAGGCNHPEIGNQYKKLAKSTLVLIPMFGVHVILFRGIPDSSTGIVWEIRMYSELFFDSFQGFFVAIIYCFINGEVLGELRRSWHLIQTTCQIQRNQRISTRPSNTYMTNLSTSASNFPLRSMASPQNIRTTNKYDELDEANIEKITLNQVCI